MTGATTEGLLSTLDTVPRDTRASFATSRMVTRFSGTLGVEAVTGPGLFWARAWRTGPGLWELAGDLWLTAARLDEPWSGRRGLVVTSVL